MKCLEKDGNRRYETANGLARDIERYLADEPVAACPPSAGYRFRKFARRNRMLIAAVGAVGSLLVLLLVGLAASNRMIAAERMQAEKQRRIAQERAMEEQHASRLARAEAAKANEVVTLMQDMLSAAHPDTAGEKAYTVRELLDEFSSGLKKRLDDQPDVEATLLQIIGSAYTRLGLVDRAEPHLRRSLSLQQHLYGARDVRVADGHRYLAWNLLERDRSDPAVERLVRKSLEIYFEKADTDRALQSQWLLVLSLDGQEKMFEAEAAAEAALKFARTNRLENHGTVPNLLHQLAWIEIRKGEFAEAERLARESVELHERIQGPTHPETAFGWRYLRCIAATRKAA